MKRIVLVLTVVMITVLSFFSVSQAQPFELDRGVRNGIFEALDALADHPDAIGLNDVSFDDLEIGEPIPVYVVTDEGLVRQGEEWPLYYDGELRLTAVELPAGFQLYTYIADVIRESRLDEVALIYDDNTFRLFDGESLYTVTSFLHNDSRAPLSTISYATVQKTCDTATITGMWDLGYSSPALLDSYAPSSSEVYDQISYVPQMYDKNGNYTGTDGLCWAATCACIYNYVHNTGYDVLDARNYYNACYGTSIVNSGRNPNQVADFLTNYGYMGTYTAYTSITEAITYWNLYYDRPIVGCYVCVGTQVPHAVTTYGIDTDDNVTYIADPMWGVLQAPYNSTSIWYYGGTSGSTYQGVANVRRY